MFVSSFESSINSFEFFGSIMTSLFIEFWGNDLNEHWSKGESDGFVYPKFSGCGGLISNSFYIFNSLVNSFNNCKKLCFS